MSYKTIDLSGFGGSYEWGCQMMLRAGEEWLAAHPNFDFRSIRVFPHVIGLTIPESDMARELEQIMVNSVAPDTPTGAMVHCVLGHLCLQKKWGSRERWLNELKADEGRVFFFDGTVASCPVTEFSKRIEGGD